jgi:hypothetical protein
MQFSVGDPRELDALKEVFDSPVNRNGCHGEDGGSHGQSGHKIVHHAKYASKYPLAVPVKTFIIKFSNLTKCLNN